MTNDKTITSQNIVGSNAIKDSSLKNKQEIKPSDAQPINELESSVNNAPIDSKDLEGAKRKELIQQTRTNGTNEQAETMSSIESSVTQNPIDQFSSGVDSKQSIVRSMTPEDLFATQQGIDIITKKTQSTLNTIGETIGKIFTRNTQSGKTNNDESVEKSERKGLGDKIFEKICKTTIARVIIGVKKNAMAALIAAGILFAACWFIGGTVTGAIGIGAIVGTIFLVSAVAAFVKTEQLKDELNKVKAYANELDQIQKRQEQTIEDLSKEIVGLKGNLEEAKSEVDKLAKNNGELKSQIENAQQREKELQEKHDNLAKELNEFQKQHEEQCSELKSQIADGEKTCKELSDNIEKQKSELADIEGQLAKQKELAEKLQSQKQLADAQLKQKENEITELNQQIKLQEDEKACLEIKIKSQKLEIDQKDSQLKLTAEQLQAVQKELALEMQNNAALKTQVEECYGCFETLINGQKESIDQLHAQFNEQQKTTNQIVNHIKGIKGGEEKLTEISKYAKTELNKAQELLSEIADLSVKITDREKMAEMLKNGTLENALATINKNTTKVQKILGDLSVKLVSDIAEVQTKIATEREAAEKKIAELSNQIDTAKSTIAQQENKIKGQQDQMIKQKLEFKAKQEKLEQEKQKIQENSQRIQATLQKEIDSNKEKLEKQQQDLKAKNNVIKQKRQELEQLSENSKEQRRILSEQILKLTTEATTAQQELVESNNRLSQVVEKAKNLQKDAKNRIYALTEKIESQKQSIEKLEKDSKAKIETMQKELDDAKQLNQGLSQDLETAKTTIQQQNENIGKLKAVNEDMAKQLQAAEKCKTELVDQNEKAQGIIEGMTQALNEMEKIIEGSKIQGQSSWLTTLRKGLVGTATVGGIFATTLLTGGWAAFLTAGAGAIGMIGMRKMDNITDNPQPAN